MFFKKITCVYYQNSQTCTYNSLVNEKTSIFNNKKFSTKWQIGDVLIWKKEKCRYQRSTFVEKFCTIKCKFNAYAHSCELTGL